MKFSLFSVLHFQQHNSTVYEALPYALSSVLVRSQESPNADRILSIFFVFVKCICVHDGQQLYLFIYKYSPNCLVYI